MRVKNNLSFNKLWYAVATMVGSIVGIGFFGIPFVFMKAGFGIGLLFLVAITFGSILLYLAYGEIILRTHERHQFVGYVRKYLGPYARWINLFNFWIAVFGATTATFVINSEFLVVILGFIGIHISTALASSIFLIVASLIIYSGLKTVARIDLIMMFLFIFVTIIIGLFSFPHINLDNFVFSTGNLWFLPFGVILFSLQGIQGLPLTREVLIGKERKLRTAIILGTCIPAVLYLVFTIFVVGVSGQLTSPEAIPGLLGFLGGKIVLLGALFGFLTSTTIFISTATAFKESLWQDYKLHEKLGFLILVIPPYVLFRLNVINFINLIGLVGGFAVSLDLILLIMVYVKAKSKGNRVPEYSISVPNWALYIVMLILSMGAIYTVLV